jgi:hypothetical protein
MSGMRSREAKGEERERSGTPFSDRCRETTSADLKVRGYGARARANEGPAAFDWAQAREAGHYG